MAALVHYVKTDTSNPTTSSTSAVELTAFTIPWTDLTTAGFVAGDDIIIKVAVRHPGISQNSNYSFAVGFGTTFAGRVEVADSVQRAEPNQTTINGDQYLWFDRRTLVTNENIYFRGQVNGSTATYKEFRCQILKLSQLSASDWFYAEADHSAVGDAPTSYDDSGAGATTAASGDWLVAAMARYLVDDTASSMYLAIHDGTGDISETRTLAADVADERVFGTLAAKAALGSGITCRARYKCIVGTLAPDCVTTKIFGLRLDAFQDHWLAHTNNTVTHSVIDTYQEFAGNGTYSKTTTGPLVVVGWPIHLFPSDTQKQPYGRIQIDGSDWPATDANRAPITSNGATDRVAPLLYGYIASQSSGTLDIDLDCAEEADIAPTYNCVEQIAVAFSLELAGAPPPPAGMVHPPAGRRFQHMIVR